MRTARALLAVAVSGICLVVMPSPAAAAEPVASVAITLTSLTPELPTRNDEITVTGRVTNITEERLYRLEALFWRNQAPLSGRAGLEQALASESNDPLGARYTGAFQDLFTAEMPFLEPNASVDFNLRVKVSELELSPTAGVYLMGVHVLQRGNNVAVGRARTFVPVLAAKPSSSLTMTSLVVLNSRPSLVRKGVLSDDHLAAEVGQNGRLTALLKAAETPTNSFVVDPALIRELQTMAGGYQVLDSEGTTSAGTGQTDATRWLEGFQRLQSSHDGYRLLYGSPDVAALVHDGQENVLSDAANAAKLVEATRSLPLLVLPAGGAADAAIAEAAAALHPEAILLADTSAKGPAPLLAGPDQVPIIRFAAAAARGGPGPDPDDTPIHLRQRLLAESWIEAVTERDNLSRGRVRLITTATQAAGAGPLAAPWLEQRTLSELLKSAPAAWPQEYHYSSAAQEAELTEGQLAALKKFDLSYDTYADLLVDATNARAEGSAAVAQAASSKWRKRDKARRAFLGPQQAALNEILLDKIQIRSSPRVQTVAREGVEFPITIRNTLEADGLDPDARRCQGEARIQLREPPTAQHQNDQGSADQGAGQLYGKRRGHRQGKRCGTGDRAVDDRIRSADRAPVRHRSAGDPERHDGLGNRHRRRHRSCGHHIPAHPPSGQGTCQGGERRAGSWRWYTSGSAPRAELGASRETRCLRPHRRR